MPPAFAPACPEIHGHRNIGASTGYMSRRGDWEGLVAEAAAISTVAAELSALSESELTPLVEFLCAQPPLPFQYLSVHGPSKGRTMPEDELVALLQRLPDRVDGIVLHPDVIEQPARYAALGSRLVLENMDRRKAVGKTADDLAVLFDALPDAGLCLDIPHSASVDPALRAASDILDQHGHRLRHLHVSSLDERCHHRPLDAEDEARFRPLLDRCRDVPWILEAPPA